MSTGGICPFELQFSCSLFSHTRHTTGEKLFASCSLYFKIIVNCLIMVFSSQINTPACLSKHNDTSQDWKMQAVVCGEGFSGPEVVNVPAGTKRCYPLTFHPSAQCVVKVTNDRCGFFLYLCFHAYQHPLSYFSCWTLCVIHFAIVQEIFRLVWPWLGGIVRNIHYRLILIIVLSSDIKNAYTVHVLNLTEY